MPRPCLLEMGKRRSRARTCYWHLGQGHRQVSWLAWPHRAYATWKGSKARSWGPCCHPGLNKSCRHCVGQESCCCSPLLGLYREDLLVKCSVNGKWEVSEDVAGQAMSLTLSAAGLWMWMRQGGKGTPRVALWPLILFSSQPHYQPDLLPQHLQACCV